MSLARYNHRRNTNPRKKSPCFLLTALTLSILPFLAGCTSSEKTVSKSPLMPLPAIPVDPGDKVLERDLQAFLEQTGAPVASSDDLARFDLNADGRREALVLVRHAWLHDVSL
jgi:hypothetical protein